MVRQKIIFRADGNHEIGLGHLSRCLALAEILSNTHETCFAIQVPDKNLLDTISRITSDNIVLSLADPSSPEFSDELVPYLKGDEIVVLDGYHFHTGYETQVRRHARAIVTIDDIPSRHFVADAIINFCGGMGPHTYSREFYTKVFTGFKYLFLRAPFLRSLPDKAFNNRLFLNMGGADPHNNTLTVLNHLITMKFDGAVDIVVGRDYRHTTLLEPLLRKHNSIRLSQGLSVDKIYRVMNSCSMAIVPPSTVSLEFLSTGGLVFLYQTADNQTLLKKTLLEQKLASDFTEFRFSSQNKTLASLFETRLKIQKEVFDGSSIERVQKIFAHLALGSQLTLRKAGPNDMQQCFEWANDSESRKFSYSQDPIPWERHVAWFQNKIEDPDCFYFIASVGPSNVGQMRFEWKKELDAFQTSYSIDRAWRGKGLSHYLLSKAAQALKATVPSAKIVGFVQEKNVASVKAFRGAGFEMSPTNIYPDSFKFELSFTE